MIEEKDDLFVCLLEDIHNNVKEIEIVQASNLSEVKDILNNNSYKYCSMNIKRILKNDKSK